MPKIQQRVANGHKLPVHHRCELAAVRSNQHIAEMKITMDQTRADIAGTMRIEPIAHGVHARNLWAGIACKLAITVELPAPATDLTFRPAVELAKITQPALHMVDAR